MPNEFQTECFFISSEIAALCQSCDDIIIKIKVAYPPEESPTFEISADGWSGEESLGNPKFGCPRPCPTQQTKEKLS